MTTSTVEIHSQQEITANITRRDSSFLLSSTTVQEQPMAPPPPLENPIPHRVEGTAIQKTPPSNDPVISDKHQSSNNSWLTRLQSMAARNEKRTMGSGTKKRQSTLLTHITTKRPRMVEEDQEEMDTSTHTPTPESTPKSTPSSVLSVREASMEVDELEEDDDESDMGQDESQLDQLTRTPTPTSNSVWCTDDLERSIPIHDEDTFLERLKKKFNDIGNATSSNGSGSDSDSQVFVKAANLENEDNTAAADALSRVIHKSDFARMKVLGQFNDSFILVMLDGYDLFIVDQHASDEKYNFEDLQANTRIESQRLVV